MFFKIRSRNISKTRVVRDCGKNLNKLDEFLEIRKISKFRVG